MNEKNIWKILYEAQTQSLEGVSYKWIEGFKKMDLHELPTIEDLNVPHWKIQPILGKSPEIPFWYRLSRGIFNVNLRLRGEDQLDYLEERDTFHDVFGHLPILYNKEYTDYVRGLGVFAQFMEDSEEARRALSNAYWFTSEFGLVLEKNSGWNTIRAYGAGIISSKAELEHALNTENKKILLDDVWLESFAEIDGYITDGFQDRYYVLPNWSYLKDILKWLWNRYVH